MGFSFRNLFNDNAGGGTGNSAQGGGQIPPVQSGGERNSLPPQAAPGGGVNPAPANASVPFDPQPTGRGNFEEMFAAGNRGAAGATGGGSMPFGAAPAQPAGPRASYTIGDLLQFVPPALATREAISPEERVEIELPADGSLDVKLSTLYKSCPQLFATEITPLNDSQLTLPAATGPAAVASPAASVSPFGTPSIAHQPPSQEPLQATGDPMAQAASSAAAPVPNPFDPNSVQGGAGNAEGVPGAGMPPQQASMSPMSWHQSEPGSEQPGGPANVQPTAGVPSPAQDGVNPFDPNPAATQSEAPTPQPASNPAPASGPVPIPAEPIEVAPESSGFAGGAGFPAAADAPGASGEDSTAGASDDMPSPFSLEEDNPFFLADDDDDADFGAMAIQAGDETDAPTGANAFDPSVMDPPASATVPESPADNPNPFEPTPQPGGEAPSPVPEGPAEQTQQNQVHGSVFAQAPANPDTTVVPPSPFGQHGVSSSPEPESKAAEASAPVEFPGGTKAVSETVPAPEPEPELPGASAPVESPWSVEAVPAPEAEAAPAPEYKPESSEASAPIESPWGAEAPVAKEPETAPAPEPEPKSELPGASAPAAFPWAVEAVAAPESETVPAPEPGPELAEETPPATLPWGNNDAATPEPEKPEQSVPDESPFAAVPPSETAGKSAVGLPEADAVDSPSSSLPSFAAAAMPNIEAPRTAPVPQSFAAATPPAEAESEVTVGRKDPEPEMEAVDTAEPEVSLPPPLPMSTAFASAMPSTPPVDTTPTVEPEPEPELPKPLSVEEDVSSPARKSIFGMAGGEVTPTPEPEPAAAASDAPVSQDTIKLPLIELLGGRSSESLGFSPKSLADGAEAELPMSRIESQLSTGQVKVTLGDLAAAAQPKDGAILAQGNQATEIDIPQNLLFHHLPDGPGAPEPEETVAELPVVEEEASKTEQDLVEVPVAGSLPPVQPAQDAAQQDNDAFAPAPADPEGADLPPSGASVGFSTPFSSFAKDDEFLAEAPANDSASVAPELENDTANDVGTETVEESIEIEAEENANDSAPAPVDWMKSVPGPLKGVIPTHPSPSDMIEIEQPSNDLEEKLLVEPPSESVELNAPEADSVGKSGVPLFGGAVDGETGADAEGSDDFTMDSEGDDEVASFFTPSRPDSEEVGVPSKRTSNEIDSLDTLPVLDEHEAEADLGGGFFDELPPPAFSFEADLAKSDAGNSESEPAPPVEPESEPSVEAEAVEAEVEVESETEEPFEQNPDGADIETDDAVAEVEEKEEADEVVSAAVNVPSPEPVTGGDPDRIRDIELRAVFGTAEEFTLQRIADLTLELCSGIDACDVLARGRTVSASRRGGAAGGAEAVNRGKRAKAMYRNVRDLADNAGLAQAEELTLHTETHAISFFTRGSACVTIHHERGEFRPGVREKLILVARGVAAFES